jgi:hypothetical protein
MRQKKDNDEETVSNQEIWSAISYLDPDTKTKSSNIVAIVTLTAISSICLACIVFTFADCKINATVRLTPRFS